MLIFRTKRHSNILTETPTQRGRRMQIGAADLPRRPLGDKLLHSECNGTSTQKGYLLPFKVYTMERI